MTARSFTTTALLVLALAAALGWAGPALDEQQDSQRDLQVAIQQATEQNRFAAAAQAMCGPHAAWEQTPDGSVQCRTKHGRPTITVRVSP